MLCGKSVSVEQLSGIWTGINLRNQRERGFSLCPARSDRWNRTDAETGGRGFNNRIFFCSRRGRPCRSEQIRAAPPKYIPTPCSCAISRSPGSLACRPNQGAAAESKPRPALALAAMLRQQPSGRHREQHHARRADEVSPRPRVHGANAHGDCRGFSFVAVAQTQRRFSINGRRPPRLPRFLEIPALRADDQHRTFGMPHDRFGIGADQIG